MSQYYIATILAIIEFSRFGNCCCKTSAVLKMASITARRNLEKKAEELFKETHCKYYDHASDLACFFKGFCLCTSIARAIFWNSFVDPARLSTWGVQNVYNSLVTFPKLFPWCLKCRLLKVFHFEIDQSAFHCTRQLVMKCSRTLTWMPLGYRCICQKLSLREELRGIDDDRFLFFLFMWLW